MSAVSNRALRCLSLLCVGVSVLASLGALVQWGTTTMLAPSIVCLMSLALLALTYPARPWGLVGLTAACVLTAIGPMGALWGLAALSLSLPWLFEHTPREALVGMISGILICLGCAFVNPTLWPMAVSLTYPGLVGLVLIKTLTLYSQAQGAAALEAAQRQGVDVTDMRFVLTPAMHDFHALVLVATVISALAFVHTSVSTILAWSWLASGLACLARLKDFFEPLLFKAHAPWGPMGVIVVMSVGWILSALALLVYGASALVPATLGLVGLSVMVSGFFMLVRWRAQKGV